MTDGGDRLSDGETEAAPLRVLLLEDDAHTAALLSDALAAHGYEVRSMGNGAVGLEAVMTFRPEVVVLDFFMPVADGRAFHQGLREVARERLGLVVMSGTPEVGDWCHRVGISEFLRKPFEPSALIEAVERAFDHAKSGAWSTPPRPSPSSYRIRLERAVLLVGDNAEARSLRALLREGTRPMQVAVVETLDDALRALGSIAVDAVALCGAEHASHERLGELLAETQRRSVPLVVGPAGGDAIPRREYVHVCAHAGPEALAARVAQLVVG